eukprot:2934761-Prymnesium_polylepis.1
MFRNTPRASSTAAYLRQLQGAARTNRGQAWGLDANTRHGLSCFFASRLWLLVRSRGGGPRRRSRHGSTQTPGYTGADRI